MNTEDFSLNSDELNFVYKVRHALNENLDNMPTSSTNRLAVARKLALSRKKRRSSLFSSVRQGVLAGQLGNFFNQPFSWLGRMGVAVPLVVLMVSLVSIYQFEKQQRINETADIDALVLSDELPLSAYLDHGFEAYLAKRGE
jgi:hypothetical protein